MDNTIVVALIGFGGVALTAILSLLGQRAIAKKNSEELYRRLDKQSELSDQRLDAKIDKYQAVTDSKLDAMNAELRKHNNVIERVYKLEQSSTLHTEQIKVANHRIEDLERKTG